jgi:c-type cytochrome biogenesis protein CcmF
MLAEIGLAGVVLAFIAALYALAASLYGARTHKDRLVNSARNAALLTFPLLLVASGSLLAALLSQQYQITYVWQVSNPSTQDFYRLTALWGSQQGSLLFWCLVMSGFSFAAITMNWRSNHRLMPYVIAYTMATLAFFIGLVVFLENPFARYWILPDNSVVSTVLIPAGAVAPSAQRLAETARGLNPLLRHFGMIIHPPMLYLGFTGFVIPFAFAMAALASGDLTTNWIKATRRWALIAWLFLALGLLLGGRWAYDVLGWGGYWGWDPVENAAFIPWLVGTAFIHSVMIQEKRGMLKVWNMFLVIFAFSAVIFGTFATRSGLIESVHSFAQSQIGMPMFLFWGGMTLISVGLIVWRWQRGELKDEHAFAGILSRETLFVLNNVVFVALALAIFWGSFGAPIFSELFLQTDITLGAEYFNAVTPPLFLALFILMGVAPLSAWGATTARSLGKSLVVPAALALAIFWGSFGAPIFSELFLQTDITLGAEYFNAVTPPLFLALFILMGVAPLSAWGATTARSLGKSLVVPAALAALTLGLFVLTGTTTPGALLGYGIVLFSGYVALYETYRGAAARHRATGENLALAMLALFGRNRRRYGGFIVHLGITIIGLGVIGSTLFQVETQQTLRPGEALSLNGYTMTYGGLAAGQIGEDGRIMDIASVTVSRDGRELAVLRPRDDLYPAAENQTPMTMHIAGSYSTLENDFYVLLAGWQGQTATFKVYINPLINLVWWGGLILIVGTIISVWPSETLPAHVRERGLDPRRAGAPA